MQIKVYRNDDGDKFTVQIPTSDGVHVADFDYDALDDSTADEPLIASVPDITTNTQFGKPIGEMPLREQELHYDRTVGRDVNEGVTDARETFPITRDRQPAPSQDALSFADRETGFETEDDEADVQEFSAENRVAASAEPPGPAIKTEPVNKSAASSKAPQEPAQNKKRVAKPLD